MKELPKEAVRTVGRLWTGGSGTGDRPRQVVLIAVAPRTGDTSAAFESCAEVVA